MVSGFEFSLIDVFGSLVFGSLRRLKTVGKLFSKIGWRCCLNCVGGLEAGEVYPVPSMGDILILTRDGSAVTYRALDG